MKGIKVEAETALRNLLETIKLEDITMTARMHVSNPDLLSGHSSNST